MTTPHRLRSAAVALVLGLAVACGVATGSDDSACRTETPAPSVARIWNEEALEAIRRGFPAPTVHARNLYHLSALVHDIWVAYEPGADALLIDRRAGSGADDDDRDRAIANGAHHLLSHRYRNAVGAAESLASFDRALTCHPDPGTSTSTSTSTGPAADDDAAQLGVAMAAELIEATIDDGSRETSNYVDLSYAPVNPPLVVYRPGAAMVDPGRWQPLSLAAQVTQNGIELPGGVQEFIGPQWGLVTTFAIEPARRGLPLDPGPPPAAGTEAYVAAAVEIIDYQARLDTTADHRIRIDPGAVGQRAIDDIVGPGHPINPATGSPYRPNEVDEADYGRVIAEFWADGPDSETPPGHWNTIANDVGDRLAQAGPLIIGGRPDGSADDDRLTVDRLEWDVKLHLAINGALHDAAIAAWGTKAHYDYVRPISMIRHLAETDQLPAVADLIEPGAHGDVDGSGSGPLVRGWRGQPADPADELAGIDWIPATEWVPYQRSSFVTPSFAAYVSGHSAFSRAAAEVLAAFTGDPYFPGGLAEHRVEPGGLIHELGPDEAVTLQWATYQDAADEAGRSRLYGGIHITADDLAGRWVGQQVGIAAWARAAELFGIDGG